jgi:hypothetical protein
LGELRPSRGNQKYKKVKNMNKWRKAISKNYRRHGFEAMRIIKNIRNSTQPPMIKSQWYKSLVQQYTYYEQARHILQTPRRERIHYKTLVVKHFKNAKKKNNINRISLL